MDYSGVVAVVLVVGLCVVPAAATTTADAPTSAAVDAPDAAVQESFDRNEVRLTVYENGSARWTFHYERTLANETERQNFESFASDFNENETPLYTRFQSDSTDLVESGANLTGRDMQAADFDRRAKVTTSLGNDIGVVEMSFTWTQFGAQEGEQVVVGDVFEGGLYLGPQQSLVVSPGPNLQFESVSPEATQSNTSSLADSDSVTWQGEREFTDNRPRVVFVPAATESTGGTGGTDGETPTTTAEPTETPGPSTGGSNGLWLVGLLGVIAVGGVATVWYLRQQGTVAGSADDGGPAAESAGDAEAGAGAAAGAAAPEPAVSEEELLTDEDRVVAMLERNGGRMKQVNIVDETGWSKSKVSMLLSDMEEQGAISKLRVGRENVISLAGHEPEATRSPFDDE